MRRHQRIDRPAPSSRSSGKPSTARAPPKIHTTTWIVLLLASCCTSFYAGAWMAWTVAPPSDCSQQHASSAASSGPASLRGLESGKLTGGSSADCTDVCLSALVGGKGDLAHKLDGKLDAILQDKIDKALETSCPKVSQGGNDAHPATTTTKRFPESVSHFASGMVRVNRKEMFDHFDLGVPMDSNAEKEDILMLYNMKGALPTEQKVAASMDGEIPQLDAVAATANCGQMNVMFVKPPERSTLQQCVAIVGGQYQSYHIQRWMRLIGEGPHGKTDKKAPLRLAGRMTKTDGYDELLYPKPNHLQLHRDIMIKYFNSYNEIRKALGDILKKIAIDNTVIVTTVNKGQSELLINFVCSSKARGFGLENLLVFPTDEFSRDLADGMGIANYYAEKLMDSIPKEEAARYGDGTFGMIMMAKVICVYLVSDLGYDMLFQDVDVIWYKDPIKMFHDKDNAIANYDVYFQDDGNRQERYTPYSANSGFYYIRNNERSKLLFKTMLYSGDLIFACRSHQQILIMLLAEANSLSGLRVKVLSRDEDEFPGGFHYHMRRDFMKKFVSGSIDPYIFHMCWTLNKDDKLKFMRQMGMWYVNDHCIGEEASSIKSDAAGVVGACCSAEPLFSCHYRDKPSIKSCADSEPKDKGGRSFW